MINRNTPNYSMFEDEEDRSPFMRDVRKLLRMQFIEICNTILYSSDDRAIGQAYNKLFRDYRQYLITPGGMSNVVWVSCLEEVLEKILTEEITDKSSNYGEMYTPYVRFLELIRDQKIKNSNYTVSNKKQSKNISSRTDSLGKFLLYTSMDSDAELKNSALVTVLKKHFRED